MNPKRKIGRLARRLVLLACLCLALPTTVLAADATPSPTVNPRSPVPTTARSAAPTATSKPGAAATPTHTAIVAPTPTPTSIKTTGTPTPSPGPKFAPKPPVVKAASAIVVEVETGRILYAKEPHVPRPMASTTKIMTALTFLSLYPTAKDLQAETTVVQEDLVGEADMGLQQGERIKLSTLLLGLMTNSANEAGMTLARYAGERMNGPADPVDRFVAAMNSKALSLGMFDSHFMNPHGLDQDGHYSSAYDLAISGWYALRNPLLMQAAQYVSGAVDGHQFYNQNSFLTRYPGAIGIKPGQTDEGGRCLVAAARHNGHTVIVTLLNSPWMPYDADPLMDYAFTLLDGKAEQPLSNLNLGTLNLPAAELLAPRNTLLSRQTLEAALQRQFEFTIRLAAAFVRK